LLPTVDDLTWARQQLWRTTGFVTEWHHHRDLQSLCDFEHLHARWDKRAETLPSPGLDTSLLVMPEAVALAEILCDLEWRRHVAIANDYDLMQFYRLVARRLGQPTKFSDRLAYSYRIDPLKSWVMEYRKQFRTVRDQHCRRVRTHHYNPQFPTPSSQQSATSSERR